MKRRAHIDEPGDIFSSHHSLSSVSSSPTFTRHTDPEGNRKGETIYEITTAYARDLRMSRKLRRVLDFSSFILFGLHMRGFCPAHSYEDREV
jgi:hypothetical protein